MMPGSSPAYFSQDDSGASSAAIFNVSSSVMLMEGNLISQWDGKSVAGFIVYFAKPFGNAATAAYNSRMPQPNEPPLVGLRATTIETESLTAAAAGVGGLAT